MVEFIWGLFLGAIVAVITTSLVIDNEYECGMRDVRTGVCTQYDLKEELK